MPLLEETDFIRDPIDRGVAIMREQQSVGVTDDWRLTDVDGIGPGTAKKLKAAGITAASDLSRVTPSQLEAIDGIGPKTAEMIAGQFQWIRNRGQPRGEAEEEVREANSERSAMARRTDRSFNAPITLDEEQWMQDPDRYDYPGVDTVPESRRAERVAEKAKRVGVTNIEAGRIGSGVSGNQTGGTVRVDVGSSWDPVSTIAHETGHAADTIIGGGRGGISDWFFEGDDATLEEAKQLALKRRGGVTSIESLEKAYHEDDLEAELFADAFALAIEEPRATQRDAPNLFRKLGQELGRDLGGL